MMNHSNPIENNHSGLYWTSLGKNLHIIPCIELLRNQLKFNYLKYFGKNNDIMTFNKTKNWRKINFERSVSRRNKFKRSSFDQGNLELITKKNLSKKGLKQYIFPSYLSGSSIGSKKYMIKLSLFKSSSYNNVVILNYIARL